ncbi:hypothetical protein CEXT_276481 [Caerostris extrusa]|uniref:Uncharacterized protein n=1 Tax=Caerostris extrusa TaxID=172846 RepID=A0AAV4PBF6_CAEEX|nr:hypothetical protein CEXT_276481 [Caerostris extrusa]
MLFGRSWEESHYRLGNTRIWFLPRKEDLEMILRHLLLRRNHNNPDSVFCCGAQLFKWPVSSHQPFALDFLPGITFFFFFYKIRFALGIGMGKLPSRYWEKGGAEEPIKGAFQKRGPLP